ncbi:MAG: ABC transporter permease [Cytophagales bacterium]|nr:ABC transporter permease [Cytophagales bacterium]
MKKNKLPLPPKWATRFLRWYCNRQMAEDLEGDIHEFYLRNIKTKGLKMARFIYVIDVLKFFRIYTVQKPKINHPMNHFLLFKNYFQTSARNLRQNWLFSLINVAGLAISMSVGLLLIFFISEIYTFDTFHKDADRIYRINGSYEYLGKVDNSFYASTSPVTGAKMLASIPGIEHLTILHRGAKSNVTYENKTIPLQLRWASDEFFDVFSFDLLAGNKNTALTALNALVITDESAKKLFGDETPINKQVILEGESYIITGVVAKPPMNSHLQFELLGSYSTYANANKHHKWFSSWNNMWDHYVYFKLEEHQDPSLVQLGLDKISEEENSKSDYIVIKAHLQPLLGIIPGANLNNTFGPTMETKMVWTLVLLGIVVLISACFNYTNLSLGRSMRRSREIGIRKVNGASGFQVWSQFILESTLISLVALMVALGLFLVLRNYFFTIDRRMADIVTLQLTPELMGYFLLLAVAVGLMAGFFPALFFSKVTVLKVLNNMNRIKLSGQFNFKKILILLQYTISLAFIIAVTLIYKQYRYSLSFDLGFNTENILNLNLFDNDPATLVNELKQLPEIKKLSQSSLVTSIGYYWGTQAKKSKGTPDSTSIKYNKVDEHYLPLHGHEFLAGGNFVKGSENDSAVNNQVIINESLLKRFSIDTPDQAIGEEIIISDDVKVIQGVLKDFHFGRIDYKISPFAFIYEPAQNKYLNILINTADVFGTMKKIEEAWKRFDPVHPMKASFYDDQIKEAYKEYVSWLTIMSFMAFLAVTIASMGLLGMVVFTTESRLKEISIRKVFGASEFNLIYLVGRGFMLLLVLAAIVAIPLTYYYVNTVIFEEIVYKVSFSFFDIMMGVIIVMAIALLTICFETVRVARTNPSTILRNE